MALHGSILGIDSSVPSNKPMAQLVKFVIFEIVLTFTA
jgi:hypothetical protein